MISAITRGKLLATTASAAILLSACSGSSTPSAASQAPGESAAATTAPSAAPGAASLTIGVVGPLSGPDAPLFDPQLKAMQFAVDTLNASGKLPGTLVLDVQDDAEKPETGTAVARKFCGDDKVKAVLGNYASTVVLAAQPVYSECGLAQIGVTASNDTLTQKGFKNFFRTTAKNSDIVTAAVAYWKKNLPQIKNVATIDGNNASTINVTDQVVEQAKAAGYTITDQVHLTANATDFRAAITSMLAKNPDMIFTGTFFNDTALFIKQASELGYQGLFWGTDADNNPKLVEIAGAASDGYFLTDLGTDPTLVPEAAEFVKAYKAKFDANPDGQGVLAYDSVRVVADAWTRAGANADRAAIVAAIAATDMQATAGSPIKYDANGDRLNPIVGIYKVVDGKITFQEIGSN